jgi:hypothetical protein
MSLKKRYSTRFALACLLLVGLILPFAVETSAQTLPYLASVNPTETTIYSNVGQLVNFTFQAVWTYGDAAGQVVEYADVLVEVKTADGTVTDMMLANTTTTGFANFNYSSSTPQILTFTPTKVFMQDETELNATLIQNGETSLYGLQSEAVTVYWDTFDVALLSTNTETLEAIQVSVNVTYLLVPEEGLTIQSVNDSQQEFFPKIAHGVSVTINGVQAEETAVAGVYSADVSTVMPTAYVIVKVSQEGWATAHKAFSFAHDANLTIWTPLAMIITLGCVVAFSAFLFSTRNAKGLVFKRENLPVFGGFLLIFSSLIGLYWVLIWFESTLHGFEWALYGIFGAICFGFGLIGGVMSVRRKNQAVALFAVSCALFANVIAVHASHNSYQLAIPWALILLAFAFSLISGLLIGNSDNQFHS